MPRYKTHARTVAELRDEFLSDIQRRLDHLDGLLRTIRPNAAEQSRLTRARIELLAIQDFWKDMELAGTEEPKSQT